MLVAVLAVAACWVLAAARPVPAATGDPGLTPHLARLAGRRSRRVAAVTVDLGAPAPVRSAFIRADAGTLFETGSVTKALTGMMLADAIERGELSMDSTAAELLPALDCTRAATVTVRELCTHTSGLPRLPVDPRTAARVAMFAFAGLDPYRGITPSRVIALAGRQRLRRRGQAAYSNLGAALLGQILAGRAGCSFPDLLRARVFTPLGMSSAAVATRQHKAAPGWSATVCPVPVGPGRVRPGRRGHRHDRGHGPAPDRHPGSDRARMRLLDAGPGRRDHATEPAQWHVLDD